MKKCGWLGALGLAVSMIAPHSAHADRVVLFAIRDNTLFEDTNGDTSCGSGPGLFCGRNSQGRARRAVLAFDVAAAIPPHAAIDSVRLELHMAGSSDLSPRTLTLQRVLAGWGEAGSSSAGGGGAPAQPGDATWIHSFYPDVPWSVPGGDFLPVASAAITVLGEGDYAWAGGSLTNDVQAWLTTPGANVGWLLIGDESQSNTARRFDSRESATPSFRPRLIVHFVLPTPTLPASWAGIKNRYR